MPGRIITSNLNAEFRKLAAETGGQDVLGRALGPARARRLVQGQLASSSSARVVEPFYSPWTQRTTVEMPTTYREKVKWRRYFYQNEPIVSSAISLHSQFPLSAFWVSHEDSRIQQDFEWLTEEISLFEFLLEMLHEYWTVGEACPYGFFDDDADPTMWKKFVLLDPTQVVVQYDPLTGEELLKLDLSSKDQNANNPSQQVDDATLYRIVSNGPNDPDTGDIYRKIPADIIDAVRSGKKLSLNQIQASRIKRIGDYFSSRGVSIIDPCFKWLAYRDKLRSAQYAVADRHVTPKEFYFIGETGSPATQEEIDAFHSLLAAQWSQPNQAIVYHHAVRVQWEGAGGRILPLQPEFQYIDRQLMISLLMHEGIITAERQPYASTSIALDVQIQRYLTLRKRLEKWIEQKVFRPICAIHKIYKRKQVELDYGIRFKKTALDLNIPRVKWDKEELRNDQTKISMLLDLVGRGWIPRDMVLPFLNIDPDKARKGVLEERRKDKDLGFQTGEAGAVMSPGMGPGGSSLPEAMPGGGDFDGGPGLPEGSIPEEGGFGEGMPPESFDEGGLPTGV